MKASILTIAIAISLIAAASSRADIIYLNNGGSIEGIIKSEDENNVEVDIGFGTITCGKREIKQIERSTPDDERSLTEKWEKKREELAKSEKEFIHERLRRFAEYDKWIEDEREKKAKELSSEGAIDLSRDYLSGNILVDATLNDKVKATLILDTGASIVVLSRRMGQELGIDLSDTKSNLATLQLAGNRKVMAKMVMLKSVRIKDIEVKDVLAGVLLEDAGIGFRDGLLGMTFLSRFNLKIDLKNMKMVLEKTG